MTQAPIDALCTQIQRELAANPKGTGVAALLGSYAKEHSDWREFQVWSDERYTRNLVHRCGAYELLLLCWEPGQVSPIHDHAGQHCWMAVLEGSLEEVHFSAGEEGLVAGRSAVLSRGEVAFIQDEIAWHLIRPVGEQRGVSLHLYANPIDSCRIFNESCGTPSKIEMGYHSVRGKGCEDVSAQEIRAEFA